MATGSSMISLPYSSPQGAPAWTCSPTSTLQVSTRPSTGLVTMVRFRAVSARAFSTSVTPLSALSCWRWGPISNFWLRMF